MIGINLKDLGLTEEKITDLVVESLTERLLDEDIVRELIKTKLSEVVESSLKGAVNDVVQKLVTESLDYEYEERDSWGMVKNKFVLKDRILKEFGKQCEYSRKGYSGDETPFTRVFDRQLGLLFEAASADIKKSLDAKFTEQCFEYATNHLKHKLGIKI